MAAIRIRNRLDSDTLHLPELQPLIGKTVDIVVVEHTLAPPAGPLETGETMFALMPKHEPLTPAERAAFLADPAYKDLWPLLSEEATADLDVDAILAARNTE